ncbi:OmpA family protein [Thiohalorhabdus sp.]|uniref:OmpA family protein n=1 Tax=Thiohalorhabdus sp. TaxID=3094134 RepID=UPI002FC3B847
MAKKKGGGSNQGSRVMFVSLFMILLAFFILLNAIATIQEERKKEALESLGGAFGQLPSGSSLRESSSGRSGGPSAPVKMEQARSQLLDQVRNIFTGKMGKGVEVRAAPGGNGTLIRIEAPATFSGEQTELPDDLANRLRRLADLAKDAETGVRVRGHTSLELDKDLEEAWWISGRRAQNVLRIFYEAGVPVAGIRMSGRGDLEPVGSESTASQRQGNERVEILLKINRESELQPLFPEGSPAEPVVGPGGRSDA